MLTQARGNETPETALQVDRYKTAACTVGRPLHPGSAIAGTDPTLVQAYRRFGAAFQRRDDLLGMFGYPEITGKPAGDDLREGKRTLPVAYGQRTTAHRRHLLRGAIGDPQVNEDTLTQIRELLIELGAVAEVEHRITELTNAALASLRTVDLAQPAITRLTWLAAQATRRTL
jgi:geranylgeranyl diphosphate synthase type I